MKRLATKMKAESRCGLLIVMKQPDSQVQLTRKPKKSWWFVTGCEQLERTLEMKAESRGVLLLFKWNNLQTLCTVEMKAGSGGLLSKLQGKESWCFVSGYETTCKCNCNESINLSHGDLNY